MEHKLELIQWRGEEKTLQAKETHAQSPFCGRNHDELKDKSQHMWGDADNKRGDQAQDETQEVGGDSIMWPWKTVLSSSYSK